MNYISTRGGISPIPFQEAVMMGLATDGGLLLPETMPSVSDSQLQSWQDLSYQQLAFEIFSLFIDDIPAEDLRDLVERSYATFNHPEVTPLIKEDGLHILELFHGPTLAFKDVALQFLGNIFEYILKKTGAKMNIIGATSGDTGSAAIYGVRGKQGINIFILHPHKRVSPIQELQMTSVLDKNVFNIAINGTFDDGQSIVKGIFNDIDFKSKYALGAVNSINWARVLAQVVYYVWSLLRVRATEQGADCTDFSVPTGNFGDIFAGYVAKSILPEGRIGRLILATNENDILSRFVLKGDYSTSTVVPTSSPSMDIQMASNFERYLYYLNGQNAQKTAADMDAFAAKGVMSFNDDQVARTAQDFGAKRVSEDETLETIRTMYNKTGYVLDPHTAVGVNAGRLLQKQGVPMVCLATAHPGKFGEAVGRAIGQQPLPKALEGLLGSESRCQVLAAEMAVIKDFLIEHAL